MATQKQPILGLSASHENIVTTIWPSVASSGIGRFLGMLMDFSPAKIPFTNIPITNAIFAPLTAPLFAMGYVSEKVLGNKYVVTNRSVQIWSSIRTHLVGEVSLNDIVDVEVVVESGQAFFHAGDIQLIGANGVPALTLKGVNRPNVFKQTILKARNARMQVAASLATMDARG